MTTTAKDPTAAELASFHAELACADVDGAIASGMAARIAASDAEPFGKGYAKTSRKRPSRCDCKGGNALPRDTRAALKTLAEAQ